MVEMKILFLSIIYLFMLVNYKLCDAKILKKYKRDEVEELTPTTINIVINSTTPNPLYELDWKVWCKLQYNGYECKRKEGVGYFRYYYDVQMQGCKTFQYGHCEHSLNQFETLSGCFQHCKDPQPIIGVDLDNLSAKVYCMLQPEFGDCQEYHNMYYYDVTSRSCRGFSYSGCGGNQNKFWNPRTCMNVCDNADFFTSRDE